MHIWLEFLCGMENLSSFGCKQPLIFQYIYKLKKLATEALYKIELPSTTTNNHIIGTLLIIFNYRKI